MWRWLRNIRGKLGISSGRAIIHVIVIEIIINALWNWVSATFTIPLIREIGFLVLIIVVLFVVAWYLPKLSPRLSGASQEKKRGLSSFLDQELSSDLERIRKGLLGRATRWDFSNIYNREPYFENYIELTNTTIFTFSILSISDFMKVEGQQCVNLPQVSVHHSIRRDEPTTIHLTQSISPETSKLIQDYGNRGKEVNFDLRDVVFEIKNMTNGYEQYNPYLTGGNYMIVPRDGLKIDDALKIEVSKCSFAKEQLRHLEALTLTVELAVRATTTPIELASLQLCIGPDKIDPIAPVLPVTIMNSPISYLVRYEVSIHTLIERSDKSEAGHILTLAMGQEWFSNEFQIPYDSPLLPQEVT